MAEPPRDLHDTPRWVRVFGLVALVVIVLFVVVMLVGGGEHGPGRHVLGSHSGLSSGATHAQP